MDGNAQEHDFSARKASARRLWEELSRCRRIFLEAQLRRLGLVTRSELDELRQQLREQKQNKASGGAKEHARG